jgi:hypothetical protein
MVETARGLSAGANKNPAARELLVNQSPLLEGNRKCIAQSVYQTGLKPALEMAPDNGVIARACGAICDWSLLLHRFFVL